MRILTFGAHPDDAEIGMGGTIAEYARRGHEVYIVIATIPTEQQLRRNEAEKAAEILGAKLIILDIEPHELVVNRELVGKFDEVVRKYPPDIAYTHWNHDSHQDHATIANAVITSTRKNNCSLYMYEQTIPGGIVPYGFRAQSFVDITEVIDMKMNSIMAYKSQIKINGEWWLYGIRGRAMYRGYQINVNYAEAFEVVKELKEIP